MKYIFGELAMEVPSNVIEDSNVSREEIALEVLGQLQGLAALHGKTFDLKEVKIEY